MIIGYYGPIDGIDEEWPYQFRVAWTSILEVRNWCQIELSGEGRYQIYGFMVSLRSAEDAALFRLAWGLDGSGY